MAPGEPTDLTSGLTDRSERVHWVISHDQGPVDGW